MYNYFKPAYYTTDKTAEAFTVTVDVPGSGPDDIVAEVRDKKLYVSVPGEDTWVLMAPGGYDASKTVATVKNGRLTLVVPAYEVDKIKIAVTAG